MENIVFYDGECGLCQRSVALILKFDDKKELQFAPLNGVTYQSLRLPLSDMTTVVFYSEGKLFFMSDAILKIGSVLGGWKKLILILKIIPAFIRDGVYKFIASHRKKVSCIILPKDQRFLK